MKEGDYLVLLNAANTRLRLFICSSGQGWIAIPEFDVKGSCGSLLKTLHGLEVVKLKQEDLEIIKLRVEKADATEERRKALRKRKLRVA